MSRPVFDRRRSEIPYISDTSIDVDKDPVDRFHAAFFIMYLQGIGVLFPWNAFITCTDYYDLRFAHTSVANSYESVFTTSFTLVGLASIVALQWVQEWVSIRSRVIGSLLTQTAVFTVAAALAIQPLLLSDKDFDKSIAASGERTFGLLVGCLCVAGMAQAVLTGSLMAYASVFNSPRYFQAVNAGMGVAGLTVSLANFATVVSDAPSPPNGTQLLADTGSASAALNIQDDRDTVRGAMLYFLFALALQLMCLASFWVIERLPYTVACKRRVATIGSTPLALADAASDTPEVVRDERSMLALLRSVWPWALSLLLIYTVTIGLFPAYTATLVASEGNAEWRRLFGPLLFIVFNAGDTIGRNMPCSLRARGVVLLLCVARAIFGPLFYVCRTSALASGTKPNVDSDAFPIIVMLVFAVSNGWLNTCAFMHAPSDVAESERKRTSTLMVGCLNTGLTLGSLTSFLIKALLCRCNPFVS